jgi:hypothetical protein
LKREEENQLRRIARTFLYAMHSTANLIHLYSTYISSQKSTTNTVGIRARKRSLQSFTFSAIPSLSTPKLCSESLDIYTYLPQCIQPLSVASSISQQHTAITEHSFLLPRAHSLRSSYEWDTHIHTQAIVPYTRWLYTCMLAFRCSYNNLQEELRDDKRMAAPYFPCYNLNSSHTQSSC